MSMNETSDNQLLNLKVLVDLQYTELSNILGELSNFISDDNQHFTVSQKETFEEILSRLENTRDLIK